MLDLSSCCSSRPSHLLTAPSEFVADVASLRSVASHRVIHVHSESVADAAFLCQLIQSNRICCCPAPGAASPDPQCRSQEDLHRPHVAADPRPKFSLWPLTSPLTSMSSLMSFSRTMALKTSIH
ncbi:hypothetical protein E2562_020358 [Oryza meyeriana var. granulata]|uniref:Uncharacterized protein n=1 Tax=Oryza meyeriana var. granulata TaxID=110450 RepID=A0A6G1DM71_9ORYZ|nr:hypothetical protein E2562_020358 [Oryza meyeriana var. granulata]